MMIHKIFIEISFTISDCPLANTESPAWKCSCRVCIKPSNISMQHCIQVPEIFCLSVCIFFGETLYFIQHSYYHKPQTLKKKNRLGNCPKTLQNQHHHETRIASRYRIRVARVASWPLDALQTRKNQSLASLQRPTHQHQSWAQVVDSCLRVSCSFRSFLMANKKKWWKGDKQGRDIVKSAFL